jgi:predicted lipoprotein
MAASSERVAPRAVVGLIIAGAVFVLVWVFPLFHVVPLKGPSQRGRGEVGATTAFDPVATAARIWKSELPAATPRALELKSVVSMMRTDPTQAKTRYAKSNGLGTAYYFVRGNGKVVARDKNYLRVALDAADPAVVALRIGPVFGNTVRDGCGLLDVNAFPGLQEFNALAAELNALVEKNVLPVLREKGIVGATVQFAGCAEVPESAGAREEPLLIIVPVEAEMR